MYILFLHNEKLYSLRVVASLHAESTVDFFSLGNVVSIFIASLRKSFQLTKTVEEVIAVCFFNVFLHDKLDILQLFLPSRLDE